MTLREIADALVTKHCEEKGIERSPGLVFSITMALEEAMALKIESLTAELAKPEDVRLREVTEAMDGRAVIFDSLAQRVSHVLDELDEWIARAGEAERNLAALRSAVKSFCDGVRHALGHGPFCSAPPSVEKDLRRWETAFRRLLGAE